jgi:hypothetical protein
MTSCDVDNRRDQRREEHDGEEQSGLPPDHSLHSGRKPPEDEAGYQPDDEGYLRFKHFAEVSPWGKKGPRKKGPRGG